jgi:hypothetical protein
MSYSSRFFLYGPFALFVALAVFIVVWWWIGAAALARRLDALNGHAIAPGIELQFAGKRIAGFPFRLDTELTDVTITVRGPYGPAIWHTPGLASHALAYDRSTTIFEAAGSQQFSYAGEGGVLHRLALEPGALRASAIVDGTGLIRFDLDGLAVSSADFAAARAQFHLRRDPVSDALDIVIDLTRVRFAGDTADGFTNGLDHARVEGRLFPGHLFRPLLSGRAEWYPTLEQWRLGGGFKADGASFFWGHCEAVGSGDLALDEARRPKGALAFTLTNCDRAGKGVSPALQGAHRAILAVVAGLIAREPADRNDTVPATLVFRDGILFLGPGKALKTGGFFEPVGFLKAAY